MRHRRDIDPSYQMSDRTAVLRALEEAGPQGVHSHDLRRLGYSGNPSQRMADLETFDGHTIHRESESRKGRPGSRYTLVADGPDAASSCVGPAEPSLTRASAVGGPVASGSVGQLFSLPVQSAAMKDWDE